MWHRSHGGDVSVRCRPSNNTDNASNGVWNGLPNGGDGVAKLCGVSLPVVVCGVSIPVVVVVTYGL